jgi:hypothetical protein
MTKDEYILYQAIVIKKQHDWKIKLFSSFDKNMKFWKYLCDNYPFFEFPCGFDPSRLLSEACFNLNIGTLDMPLRELGKLADEYYANVKDKTTPNSKEYCKAINEEIKKRRDIEKKKT